MKVLVNDTEIKLPSTLAEITLGQRIAYHNQYGKDIHEALQSIEDMPEDMRELEQAVLYMDIAVKQFSFFSGIPLRLVEDTQALEGIMEVCAVMNQLLAEDVATEYKAAFEWEGCTWELHPPELKNGSSLTFGELVDSKQILQDLQELGAGRWESLQRLCAIYLRKQGEPYHKSFADESGERVRLMAGLPLDIALSVSFFLSNSTSLFLKHSVASQPAG